MNTQRACMHNIYIKCNYKLTVHYKAFMMMLEMSMLPARTNQILQNPGFQPLNTRINVLVQSYQLTNQDGESISTSRPNNDNLPVFVPPMADVCYTALCLMCVNIFVGKNSKGSFPLTSQWPLSPAQDLFSGTQLRLGSPDQLYCFQLLKSELEYP